MLVERGLKVQSFVVKGVSPSLEAAAGVAQACGYDEELSSVKLIFAIHASLPHVSATTSALKHLIIP